MSDAVAGDVAKAIELFDRRVGLAALWVFGSQATGTARADSDLDLAALFRRRTSPLELIDLSGELAAQIGRSVDLVDLDRAGPPLARQVLQNGALVLDRDVRRRIAFTSALPGRYQDVAMMRAPIERAMLERFRSGRA